jgi:hypothetical protein
MAGARPLTGEEPGYARGVNEGIRASSEEDVLILNPTSGSARPDEAPSGRPRRIRAPEFSLPGS